LQFLKYDLQLFAINLQLLDGIWKSIGQVGGGGQFHGHYEMIHRQNTKKLTEFTLNLLLTFYFNRLLAEFTTDHFKLFIMNRKPWSP
jgi:hypothetical protein